MSEPIAAIDFGTSKIVTVIAENGGLNKCTFLGTGNVPYDGWQDGEWINTREEVAEAIRNSINAAELEAKMRVREIYVGVPSGYIKTVTAVAETEITGEGGRVSEEDIEAVQDAAANQLGLPEEGAVVLHRSPAWFQIDDGKKTIPAKNDRGRTLRAQISFILADEYFIEDVSKMLNALGISVYGFLFPPLGESLLMLDYSDRDKACVLIDGGYLVTDFMVLRGDAIVYHAQLPIGCGDIAAALAEDLQISMASAEKVKRELKIKTASFDEDFDELKDIDVRMENGKRIRFKNETVQSIVTGKLEELTAMLSAAIDAVSDTFDNKRGGVYLTGGLSQMKCAREFLSERLELPVKVPLLHSTKLNGGQFSSVQGLVELIFEGIEDHSAQEESFPNRLAESVMGLIKKKNRD